MPWPRPGCYSSLNVFNISHDADNDCSSLPVKLFVLNDDNVKLTSGLFSVLNSLCEIYPGQIFTLLLEDKNLMGRIQYRKNWVRIHSA